MSKFAHAYCQGYKHSYAWCQQEVADSALIEAGEFPWLPVDICFDVKGNYAKNHHSVFLYMRNGYDKNETEWLPIIVQEHDAFFFFERDLKIKRRDADSVCLFAKDFAPLICKVAAGELSLNDFLSDIPPCWEPLMEHDLFAHTSTGFHTWFNVNLCFDDDQYYKTENHPLWFYARNGHTHEDEEWLKIIVTDKGVDLSEITSEIKIRDKNFKTLCDFVNAHHEDIRKLADSEINFSQFVTIIQNYEHHINVQNWAHMKPWFGMDVYLDDNKYYIKNNHPLWLYFRNGYTDDCEEWQRIVVTDNGHALREIKSEVKIDERDFSALCHFVDDYHDEIRRLADGELNFTHFCETIEARENGKFKEIADGPLRFQLVQDWCVYNYYKSYGPATHEVDLREYALKKDIEKLRSIRMSSSTKRRMLTKLYVKWFDYDDPDMIWEIVHEEFQRLGNYQDEFVKQICQDFADNIHNLIAEICRE